MSAVLPPGIPLIGRLVRLDPLVEADAAELLPLFADPAVYGQGYVMHAPPRDAAEMLALMRRRLIGPRPAGHAAYAVRLSAHGPLGPAGTLVGTSSLLDAEPLHERIHLGSTLYGSRWWGSGVNAETKLLLLGHAFDDCGFGRVKLQTDALNTRSQAALARLGATREGVLRRHLRREDGTFRDTVVFSILLDEWPRVRDGLLARLS